jgi:hypothetical protein
MMKPILFCLLTMALTVTGALGQACERTFTVGAAFAPAAVSLQPGDIDATLGKQTLTVTKVEPIRSSRVLILIAEDFSRLSKDKNLKQLTTRLAVIDAIPANIRVAYAATSSGETAFSDGFTSDPQELRSGLQKLISGAATRIPARPGMDEVLNFFGQPQPGDSVVLIGEGGGYPADVQHFLEEGTRLFILGGNHWDMQQAEATGGNYGGLDISRKKKQAEWQVEWNFWLSTTGTGYAVTVAIPPGVRVEDFSWRVRLSQSGLSRLGPKKAHSFDYPDLLLCDSTAKTRIATAVRPRY